MIGAICVNTGAPVGELCELCVNHHCDGYKMWLKEKEESSRKEERGNDRI